jgi:hypothetical protein
MERTQILDLMSSLKLYGMRSAYDEIMAAASSASTSRPASSATCSSPRSPRSRPARSSYQLTIAKLPLAKDIDQFDFEGTPVNEGLVRELAGGASSPTNATSS